MTTNRRTILRVAAAGALAGVTRLAPAQEDKGAVTVLVGAGSTMDYTARMVADQLREGLNRPTIVLSKLGAGGRLALNELKHAPPDGRLLMFSTSSPFAIYPNIYTKLEYDPVTDFTPIAGVTWFDVGIAVAPQLKVENMAQLISWVKAQSGPVVYGCAPGNGSASHFAGIATSVALNLPLTPVPYKDSGPAVTDVITGRIPLLITGTGALVEMHRSGRLRVVGTSGDTRSPQIADVPTLKESGVDVRIVNSAGLYGPAGMSADLVKRIYAATMPMLERADMRDKLVIQSMVPNPMTGKQLADSLAEERKRYAGLVKASGYVPEAAS